MSDREETSAKHLRVGIGTLVFFVLVAVGLQALGAFLEIRFLHSWQDRSHFGEMFGAINTLFSGLAFAGVIFTILLQRRELELQRISQVRSEHLMAVTARLSALNSLVEATSRQLVDMRNRSESPELMKPVAFELDRYISQIKESLE